MMFIHYLNANSLPIEEADDELYYTERRGNVYCKTSQDCDPDNFCDTFRRRYMCYKKKADGKLCNSDDKCMSGHCHWFKVCKIASY